MDKIEKIRQEIERLKKQEKENEKAELMSDSWILGRQVMLEHFEHFLNTLSEEPDKSLEEEYMDFVVNDPVYTKLVNRIAGLGIARHFAEWGAEHLKK